MTFLTRFTKKSYLRTVTSSISFIYNKIGITFSTNVLKRTILRTLNSTWRTQAIHQVISISFGATIVKFITNLAWIIIINATLLVYFLFYIIIFEIRTIQKKNSNFSAKPIVSGFWTPLIPFYYIILLRILTIIN